MSPAGIMQLAVALPAAASVPIVITGRSPNLREAVTLVTAAIVLLLVGSAVPAVLAGDRPEITLLEIMPGLTLTLRLEPLGMLFALVASFLWLITSIYSIGYMRGHHESNQTRFFACFAIAIASALGVAFAGNMLTLFVAYEVLSISTYPLVTHAGTEQAKRAGRVYLGILLGTSIGLQLLAIIWTWTSPAHWISRKAAPGGRDRGPAAAVLLALYVFGIGKAAVMPFHRWLPAAMVAPTPVSALLHAVAVVKAGVFAVLKVVIYIFGTDFILQSSASDWLVWFAGATILLASLVAMTKDNLKARLAYSTISQLSYIVLGALLATQASIMGSMMHIVMHAFAKITLFFAAGAILVAAHKSEISDMAGLGRAMPITFGAFFVASLSIIGLPPFGGMWSKWYLGLGTIESGQWLLLTVLLVSSLLNIAYLLPIPIRAFFSKAKDGTVHTRIQEAPASCLAAMIITSLACLVLFFYPEPFYQLATITAGAQ